MAAATRYPGATTFATELLAGEVGIVAPTVATTAATALAGGKSYVSFDALKTALGPAGAGNVWHHIVEQCQGNCTGSAFPSEMINNTKNVVAIPKEVNQALADLYSRKGPSGYKSLRDWLNKQLFEKQLEFGKSPIQKFRRDCNALRFFG